MIPIKARFPATPRKPTGKPTVVGAGLIALDVVIDEARPGDAELRAGGTCGNVLTILSYLGWRAYALARLRSDPAGELVAQDMKRWGVRLEFGQLSPTAATPIIVERLVRAQDGVWKHRFSWKCPSCGTWLPGYRPISAAAAEGILRRVRPPGVFFFDRVSRGTLTLARRYRDGGSLVFFEPSGMGDPSLFEEALGLTHVLKYSEERGAFLGELRFPTPPLLEIETLGGDGIRYRSQLGQSKSRGWRKLPSYPARRVRDAAGAGDWCTAGIIHRLAGGGLSALRRCSATSLEAALRFGQALAAWNCEFRGARGGMYASTRAALNKAVRQIIEERGRTAAISSPADVVPSVERDALRAICPGCDSSADAVAPPAAG
jgi:fructokinase